MSIEARAEQFQADARWVQAAAVIPRTSCLWAGTPACHPPPASPVGPQAPDRRTHREGRQEAPPVPVQEPGPPIHGAVEDLPVPGRAVLRRCLRRHAQPRRLAGAAPAAGCTGHALLCEQRPAPARRTAAHQSNERQTLFEPVSAVNGEPDTRDAQRSMPSPSHEGKRGVVCTVERGVPPAAVTAAWNSRRPCPPLLAAAAAAAATTHVRRRRYFPRRTRKTCSSGWTS